jgi:hypothetical protein
MQFKGFIPMRKIVLVAAAAAGALTLAACSEGTEDAAEATVEEGMADAEANMEAMEEGAEEAVADAEEGMAEAGDAMEEEAAEAE